jgi:hypothetical protein
LSKLEELSLSADAETLRLMLFADHEFTLLMLALPCLTVPHFLARTDITPAALRIVGEKCRLLETLSILQRFQLERFPDPTNRATALLSISSTPPKCLFLKLKTLWAAYANLDE